MKKKIFYTGFSDERVEVVDFLKSEYNYEPDVFVANIRDKKSYLKKYPNSIFLESMNMRLGKFDWNIFKKKYPVDKVILNYLSKYEYTTLNLIEDTNGRNFSYDERFQYYFDILSFWNTLIRNLKPDYFIAFTWPHNTADYTMYSLCKYYEIETYFIDPTPYLGNNFMGIQQDLDNLSKKFIIKDLKKRKPSQKIIDYLHSIRIDKVTTPNDIYKINELMKFSFWKEIMLLIYTIKNWLKKEVTAFKFNKKEFGTPGAHMNIFQYRIFKIRTMIKNNKYYKNLKSISVKANLSEKYVLFAANYQPEATTSVTSSYYVNQINVLELLSSTIPEDTIIYYKEYPKHLLSFFNKISLNRNNQFLSRLKKIKNIKIIDDGYKTTDLIDNAFAVATITGTIGWEAAVRGKPVITFGSVWYNSFNKIFKIDSYKDLTLAFNKIENGYSFDYNDILDYAAYIEKNSHKKFIHTFFSYDLKKSNDKKYEMQRLGRAIYQYINKINYN